MDLKKADFNHWNYVSCVTLNEFIYLAAGYEPLHIGAHGNSYLNLSHSGMKEFYIKVKRLGDELPNKTIPETEVSEFWTLEPKYEAIFLMRWAQSKNIPTDIGYKPVETEERKKKRFIANFLGRNILSYDEFVQILTQYNPDNSKEYFRDMVFDALQGGVLELISETQNCSAEHEERNFKFKTDSLVKYATQMKWNVPEELGEIKKDLSREICSPDNEDVINLKKLKSIYIVLLSMAVAKYEYNPNKERNAATGTKAGSIKADVQALGSNLDNLNLNLDIKEDTVKALLDEASAALLQ